ncbi:MAG: hypothetical protein P8L44_16960 [Opitutales bacterium]|nr:hypothetical protein [Opitutales bacterium]
MNISNKIKILASAVTVIVCVGVIVFSLQRANSKNNQNRSTADQLEASPPIEVAMAKITSAGNTTSVAKSAPLIETPIVERFGEDVLKVIEVGYHHVALKWDDNEQWNFPWLIQRSTTPEFIRPTDLKFNQAADNTGKGTFRWLGINADNYVDIDGLDEGMDYYYRVASVTNMSLYRKNGDAPQFTDWQHGKITTKVLEDKKKQVYDVTSEKYGAVPNDGLNDYPAVLAAYNDARKARGGSVYLPAGKYELWPEHKDIEVKEGIPTIRFGKRLPGALFEVTADNITFVGDVNSEGQPDTFIELFLWGKVPMTEWLEELHRNGEVENVRRYHLFILDNVENFTLRNLDIDGGAVPVNTGKEWYSLDDKRYQWDVSNKLIATWDFSKSKNVIVDNVDTRNWRGEVYYNGGGSQKFLLKDGSVSQTNSSTVSGSFDLELVNMTISDSANSSIESALFSEQKSPLSRFYYSQNHIARECTFIGLDQSDEGIMKNLPGEKKGFNGWLVFNQEGTYQTVTDCEFKDLIYAAYGPWYESRNTFLYNSKFHDPAPGASHIFFTWTSAQGQYRLKGGFSEVLWLDNELRLSKSLQNHQPVFYSQVGGAAKGNESPWIWEGFHITNVSGSPIRVNRFWVDTWGFDEGRELAIFEDFTKDDSISFDAGYLQDLNAKKIHPNYVNFFD